MEAFVKLGLSSCGLRSRFAVCALLLCVVAIAAETPHVATAPESNVKAAFLHKFLSYVEWPQDAFESPSAPITIGILENDAVATALMEIAEGHTVGDRPVIVRPMRRSAPMDGLHVLFIGRAAEARLERLVSTAESNSIMTVAEADASRGSIAVINFLLIDGRVRFGASLPAAHRVGVKLSSRLLAVAETVQRESH